MNKLFIPLFMLIGINGSIHAQEKSHKELKGDRYAFTYSYQKAIDTYKHTKHLTLDGQRNLAMSYHKTGQNVLAESAYAQLLSEVSIPVAEDYYNYATVLKMNGKYDESAKWMEKFQEAKPDDLRAKSYVNNRIDFKTALTDDGKFKIIPMDINTTSDDFGTSYYMDQIVFASTRQDHSVINRKYNWNNQPFLDLYVSELDGKQLKAPKTFEKCLNTKFHDGPASFSKDGTMMAFSRNNPKDKSKDKVVEIQIYTSTKTDGKWAKPEAFKYNDPAYSVAQPFLSNDGKTMFFASNMPGGFGGADLYKSTKNDKNEWSKPENLGSKINTEGDEMFPFLQEKKNLFFFTSDGHNGFGGLDIFMCMTNENKFGHVSNIGFPLNSAHDDYALICNDTLSNGYFSSNRDPKGFDNIYSVDFLKLLENGKIIKGFARDKNDAGIPFTNVTLQEENSSEMDTLTSKEDGSYSFLAQSNKMYMLTGSKKDYLDGHNNASTYREEPFVYSDVVLQNKFIIDSTHLVVGTDLGVVAKTALKYEGNISKDVAYFDLDKSNIRPDAAKEMDKIVSIMNDYPTIVIQLGSYTDCSASKTYNQQLSERRAQASLEYIKKRITKPERITGFGYGETKLVNSCDCQGVNISTCPDAENQKNRRTEFIIMKN